MARNFFRPASDLADRGGYYLLVGIIGFVLLFFDQRTEIFHDLRSNINRATSTIFLVSGETRRRVRSQLLTIKTQTELVKRIEELEITTAKLQAQIFDRNALISENNDLRDQLKLEIRQRKSLLFAEVNAISYKSNFDQSIVISRGADEGAVVGQAVISDVGVIGQVSEVFDSSSVVLLITAISHALPVLISGSRSRLIAEGTGVDDFLIIHDININKKIQDGELVFTSGLGEVFPAGYPVGKVESSNIDEVTGLQEILIRPFIDTTTIAYVFLIVGDKQNP